MPDENSKPAWRKWETKRISSFRKGKDLKKWRESLDLQIIEIAALLGMHQTTITAAERSSILTLTMRRALASLKEAIDSGEVNVAAIIAARKPRGRPSK
jgi:predicted transcriptional regulator